MALYVNRVFLVGNLGRKPDVLPTKQGRELVTFSLATNSSYLDRQTNQWIQNTEWHRIVVFNPHAVSVAKTLDKGSYCLVEGSLRTRRYMDQTTNTERTSVDVQADNVFALQRVSTNMNGNGYEQQPTWDNQPNQNYVADQASYGYGDQASYQAPVNPGYNQTAHNYRNPAGNSYANNVPNNSYQGSNNYQAPNAGNFGSKPIPNANANANRFNNSFNNRTVNDFTNVAGTSVPANVNTFQAPASNNSFKPGATTTTSIDTFSSPSSRASTKGSTSSSFGATPTSVSTTPASTATNTTTKPVFGNAPSKAPVGVPANKPFNGAFAGQEPNKFATKTTAESKEENLATKITDDELPF